MKLSAFVLGTSLLICGSHSMSAEIETQLDYVRVYGSGTMYLGFHEAVPETGCPGKEVRVLSTHPMYQHFLTLAMASFAAKPAHYLAIAHVKTNGCSASKPLLDNSSNSFFEYKQVYSN